MKLYEEILNSDDTLIEALKLQRKLKVNVLLQCICNIYLRAQFLETKEGLLSQNKNIVTFKSL